MSCIRSALRKRVFHFFIRLALLKRIFCSSEVKLYVSPSQGEKLLNTRTENDERREEKFEENVMHVKSVKKPIPVMG